MALPQDLLLRSPEEGARRVALTFLDEAHAGSRRLDDADDKEALHDFRVGIRRLRSTARAWKDVLDGALRKRDRRALKALQNATGGGRDAEVAIAWLETQRDALQGEDAAALDGLVASLRARLADAMAHATGGLREQFDAIEQDLRRRLGTLSIELDLGETRPTLTFAEALARKAREHADELVLHLSHVASLADEDEAHEARIMGKRMRYLVEPIRPWVPEARALVKQLKGLQDILGDMNDARVLNPELEAPTLAPVKALNRARAEDLFARLEAAWLGEGAADFRAAVEGLAVELESLARGPVEIERKYLLSEAPALPATARTVRIDQGWLPGKAFRERLRREIREDGTRRYTRTIKFGRGIQRTELEEETGEALFDGLWALTEGCRVEKRRHRVDEGGFVWEVDEFLDRDLWLAEVELPSADAEAELPPWLASVVQGDVTGDKAYVNLSLAQ